MQKQNEINDWMQDNIEEAQSVSWQPCELPFEFECTGSVTSIDHTHCIICWKTLNRELEDKAYESSIGWICEDCYVQHTE